MGISRSNSGNTRIWVGFMGGNGGTAPCLASRVVLDYLSITSPHTVAEFDTSRRKH